MKAGNATEAQIDLRLRGGTVIMRRLTLPLRTRVSWYAMAPGRGNLPFRPTANYLEQLGKALKNSVDQTISIGLIGRWKEGPDQKQHLLAGRRRCERATTTMLSNAAR
jgi:hypothetical protein